MDIKDIKDSKTLWKLRSEIIFGSVFVDDYKNSLEIDKDEVYNFFDSYMEYLSAIHYSENNGSDDTFWDYVAEHDNIVDLYDYFEEYVS